MRLKENTTLRLEVFILERLCMYLINIDRPNKKGDLIIFSCKNAWSNVETTKEMELLGLTLTVIKNRAVTELGQAQ